jgi:hypothetical protein
VVKRIDLNTTRERASNNALEPARSARVVGGGSRKFAARQADVTGAKKRGI